MDEFFRTCQQAHVGEGVVHDVQRGRVDGLVLEVQLVVLGLGLLQADLDAVVNLASHADQLQ